MASCMRLWKRAGVVGNKHWFSLKAVQSSLSHKEVRLTDGYRGTVVSESNGWLSIQLQGTSKIVRARSSHVTLIDQQQSGLSITREKEKESSLKLESPLIQSLTPPTLHTQTLEWIVFSDLHVKPTSIDTCELVLNSVHDEAVKRNAGIIFLGDFWHVRGSLSVDLLNRVMKALEKWTQPVIMIPGNHDQVNLGGSIHALEPLVYAFRPEQALLINDPAVCMDALWLPYRRDNKLLQRILQATPADVSMVFCHADIRGAYMNDGIRCKEGLEVDNFPKNKPIFSGHFHKPHTLTKNSVSVRYVGSPYQTSLSEADQQKLLYLLSSSPGDTGSSKWQWKELDRWPIDFGRKYYRAVGLQDGKLAKALPGDKVVLSVSLSEKDQADTLAQSMRQQGIEIELRAEEMIIDKSMSVRGSNGSIVSGEQAANSRGQGEKLSSIWSMQQKDAHMLFEEYIGTLSLESLPAPSLKQNRKEQEVTTLSQEDLADQKTSLTKIGHLLLNELLEANPKLHHTVVNDPKDLSLSSVELRNFGPYGGDPVTYPLDQRGLVLIRGVVEDDTGADSNGSGKTTLAMSVMWCLTGSLDARLIADSKSADVTYDNFMTDEAAKSKRVASVVLHGQINGKDFMVSRKKGSRKTELNFMLDGKDMTTLSIKDTQSMIDEHLGIGNNLLARCCFFGQHSHTQQSLLGLQDTGLKYELGRLVDVTVWIEAAKLVRLKEKLNEELLREIGFGIKTTQEELKKALHKEMMVKMDLQSKSDELTEQVKVLDFLRQSHDEIVQQYNETELILSTKEQIRNGLQKDSLEPARQSLLALLEKATDKSLEQQQQQVQLELHKVENLVAGVQQQYDEVHYQLHEVASSLNSSNSRILSLATAGHFEQPLDFNVSMLPSQLLEWRADLEGQLGNLGSLDAMVLTTNATYIKLKRLCSDLSHSQIAAAEDSSSVAVSEDACPTCGQDLPAEDREARITSCKLELQQHLASRQKENNAVMLTRQKISRGEEALQLLTTIEELDKTKEKLQKNLQSLDEVMQGHQVKIMEFQTQLDQLSGQQAEMEKAYEQEKGALQSTLACSEAQLKSLEVDIAGTALLLDSLRTDKRSAQTKVNEQNAHVNILRNTLHYTQKDCSEKEEHVRQLQAALACSISRKAELMQQSLINEQLVSLFGPKGIQNYIFSSALVQLEALANDYLQVLSEGGMELSLRSDEDGEKIIKTVMMKRVGADGVFYKERALSLLSGGQWRRVSLALDLAFTDMIRKQGKLRCSLLVMDEVLSHLDGQGREAVGSILRALASPSRYRALTDTSTSAYGGVGVVDMQEVAEVAPIALRHDHLSLIEMDPYDTILVILQDAAAAEMEESFDHIDVVTKRQFSTVEVDGLV